MLWEWREAEWVWVGDEHRSTGRQPVAKFACGGKMYTIHIIC